MLSKRLIGVITVRGGWAVQSFGYARYLPLGRPEILAENLDRWGADEILVQVIDRSPHRLGPDLELLGRIGRLGLTTPLIYAGGIASPAEAIAAVAAGADRIAIDALLHDDPAAVAALAEPLGAQAVIACLPLRRTPGGTMWHDYRSGRDRALAEVPRNLLRAGVISEAMIVDRDHEGARGGFDPALLDGLDLGAPLIAFGGISEPAQLRDLVGRSAVAAVGIGNFLAYREHEVQRLRAECAGLPLRPPTYEATAQWR